MSSAKGTIVRLLSGVLLKRATVASVQHIGGFRRLRLRCKLPPFSAGAKVQLLLPSNDMRTYTPIRSPEGIVLLGWTQAGGPGTAWLTNAQLDEALPFVGPQRSLQLDASPVVLIGDETSVAVAATFAIERPESIRVIIQTEAAAELREAAASVGLPKLEVIARGDTAATVAAATAQLSMAPGAVVALTGGSELVATTRAALRRAGVRKFKTKTYWVPGKTGLD